MNDGPTVPPPRKTGDAGDASGEADKTPQSLGMFDQSKSVASDESAEPSTTAVTPVTRDIGDESVEAVTQPPKSDVASPASPKHDETELTYSLTLKQVPEILQEANRKSPSLRSLARYCRSGDSYLKCQKIKTTEGQEWLVNEESLSEYIDHQPILIDTTEASSKETADTSASGDAGDATILGNPPGSSDRGPSTSADTFVSTESITEERTVASVLIVNAGLVAKDEEKDRLINELKEDRNFLREEVIEARKHRGEVKGIAEKMLETMTTMATVNRLGSGEIEKFVRGGKDNGATDDVV